jgi:hypothetical protein
VEAYKVAYYAFGVTNTPTAQLYLDAACGGLGDALAMYGAGAASPAGVARRNGLPQVVATRMVFPKVNHPAKTP